MSKNPFLPFFSWFLALFTKKVDFPCTYTLQNAPNVKNNTSIVITDIKLTLEYLGSHRKRLLRNILENFKNLKKSAFFLFFALFWPSKKKSSKTSLKHLNIVSEAKYGTCRSFSVFKDFSLPIFEKVLQKGSRGV